MRLPVRDGASEEGVKVARGGETPDEWSSESGNDEMVFSTVDGSWVDRKQ